MRRMLVLGSAVGALVLSSACATTTGGNGTSAFSSAPSSRRMSRQEQVVWRDSVYAQAIADVEGPGATIRAEFSSMAGSRRVRARFNLEADAYVLIGHIDGAGVLRIAFPTNPATDDGLVKGNRSYQTHEFFAGFTDEYRFRTASYRPTTRNPDSYDGGLGFMFIIASWRPMHFDRFREGDSWDSFELTDDSYLRDPRPAIYELATLLVGESREAYTVKFARYTNTTSYAMSPFGGNAYNSFSYCNGYQPLGFAFDPLADGFLFNMMSSMNYGGAYGGNFSRRGVNYFYDSFGDCYRTGSPFRYGNGLYRIASGPTNPGGGGGTVKRPFDPEGLNVPLNPRPTQPSRMPGGRVAEGNTGSLPTASPTYRSRGLITSDDQGLPGRREPRVAAGEAQVRSRPSIQDMVGRRPSVNEGSSRAGSGYTRSNGSTYGSSSAYDRPTARDRSSGSGYSGSSSDGGSRFGGSSSSGSSVGATSGGTGGSSAAASTSSGAASTGTTGTATTGGGRPPL